MKLILKLLFCFIFSTLFVGELKAQNNDLEKAKLLWEKVIAAKGGRENLYAVKNFVVSTKSHNPYDKKEFQNSQSEELYVLSGKWWAWTDDRPGFTLDIWQYDFEREIGYEVSEKSDKVQVYKPLTPQTDSQKKLSITLDGERFNNFAKEHFLINQLIYMMETKWFQPTIKGLQTERVKGEKLNVIEVSFGRQKLEYFINPKTNLPNKIRRSVWFDDLKAFDNEDVLYLEDYIEVAGLKFPQVIRRSKKTDTKTAYLVNVKYNEKIFDTLPSIEAGEDAWKPK